MANYRRGRHARTRVKRSRHSFYTRKSRWKSVVGILVLVVVVLVAAWLAAPYVLNWATHTWYTVVRNRDLTASSASATSETSEALAESAAASAASSEAAAQPETVPVEIVDGNWGEVSAAELTDTASIRIQARKLASQNVTYALVMLKDSDGTIYYSSQVSAAANSIAGTALNADQLEEIFSIFAEEGLIPVAGLTAFRDPIAARTVRSMAIHYAGQDSLWLDNKASAGGNPWLNPYSEEAVTYVGDLIAEVRDLGFEHILLKGVQFPSASNSKQDFGATGGRSRDEQLAADIAVWQEEFGSTVTLWYGYSLSQTEDSTTTLGVPAWQLGIENLVVEVPSSTTLDTESRTLLEQTLADGGVKHSAFLG